MIVFFEYDGKYYNLLQMRYFETDKHNNNIIVCFDDRNYLIIVDDHKKDEFNLLIAGYLKREYSEYFP